MLSFLANFVLLFYLEIHYISLSKFRDDSEYWYEKRGALTPIFAILAMCDGTFMLFMICSSSLVYVSV
jgi:hypothetical protein